MNTTLLPDPYLLEVRFIVERLFKQTVSMNYMYSIKDMQDHFHIHLNKSNIDLDLVMPVPYKAQELESYIKVKYPEYFI